MIDKAKILEVKNGVAIISQLTTFEADYLSVRKLENRIYENDVLEILPKIDKAHEQYEEWRLRQKSSNRFLTYLNKNFQSIQILDLGTGNGWFANKLAEASPTFQVTAVDMNLHELQQGASVFTNNNLNFYYANIFDDVFQENSFDLVVINSVIQYFESLPKLIHRLLELLRKNGSIHILDSPIYEKDAKIRAAQRSKDYFRQMGVPNMSKNYFHHTWEDIEEFNFEIKYNPKVFKNKIKKLFGDKDIPFPWTEIKR